MSTSITWYLTLSLTSWTDPCFRLLPCCFHHTRKTYFNILSWSWLSRNCASWPGAQSSCPRWFGRRNMGREEVVINYSYRSERYRIQFLRAILGLQVVWNCQRNVEPGVLHKGSSQASQQSRAQRNIVLPDRRALAEGSRRVSKQLISFSASYWSTIYFLDRVPNAKGCILDPVRSSKVIPRHTERNFSNWLPLKELRLL